MRVRALLTAAVLLAAAVAVLAVALWRADQRWKGTAAIEDQNDRVRTRNWALHESLAVRGREVDEARQRSSFWERQTSTAEQHQGMLLNEFDISHLKKKGLPDPESDLRRDLMGHPELIPMEGILGGTMGFVEDSIALLSQQWVYAEFEDGHTGGCCLLSYEVGPGGHISWHVLAAAPD
jgi:hypothetical protein